MIWERNGDGESLGEGFGRYSKWPLRGLHRVVTQSDTHFGMTTLAAGWRMG